MLQVLSAGATGPPTNSQGDAHHRHEFPHLFRAHSKGPEEVRKEESRGAPVNKNRSTSTQASVRKEWSSRSQRGKGIVSTDFSPGETKILDELYNVSDTQVTIDRRVDELIRTNKDLAINLSRLQAKLNQLDGEKLIPVRSTPHHEPPHDQHESVPVNLLHPGSDRLATLDSDRNFQISDRPNAESAHNLGYPALQAPRQRRTEPTVDRDEDMMLAETSMQMGVLGDGWPANVMPRRLAALNTRKANMMEAPTLRSRTTDMSHQDMQRMSTSSERKHLCGCGKHLMRHFVIHPNSWFRIVFDLASLVVLLWDLTVIPYLLAWDIASGPGTPWQTVAWATVGFWTMDIIMNCSTAIVEEGKLVMDPKRIFQEYVRTWFVPDCLIVLCDWSAMLVVLLVDSNGNTSLKMLRFAKLGRLLRIMGMLKVFKAHLQISGNCLKLGGGCGKSSGFPKAARVMEEFLNRTVGETYRMSMKILGVIFSILWINHILCCGWFTLGRAFGTDTGLRWFESNAIMNILDHSLLFQSLSQVTLGATEVYSTNSVEKMYTVAVLVFGLLFGSTLVSSLSATMVEFQMLRNGRKQKLRMLRQFLCDYSVDLDISYLVQKQVKERLGPSDRLTEEDVPVLAVLSVQLLAELRMEIYREHLVKHPLFSMWLALDRSTFVALCSELGFMFLRAQDQLFVPGPADETTFVFIKGSMSYVQTPDSSFLEQEVKVDVAMNSWLAEPAVWSYWRHVGTAEANKDCQLMIVHAENLNHALQTRHLVRKVVQQYEEIYHKRIVRAKPPEYKYPNDLNVPDTEIEDMIVAMDMESQVGLGLAALKQITVKYVFQENAPLSKLKTEVEQGKSTVMLSKTGEVFRVVNLVTVKVSNGLGQVLAQIAVYDHDKKDIGIKIDVVLPGLKLNRQEEPKDAANRCIEEKVPALAGCIDVNATVRMIEMKRSKEYGVRTKYIKTVCPSSLSSVLDLQEWQANNNLAFYRDPSRRPSSFTEHHTSTSNVWDIYPMCGHNKVFFYAWITEEELTNMVKDGGDATFRSRLEGIDFEYDRFQRQLESARTFNYSDPATFAAIPTINEQVSHKDMTWKGSGATEASEQPAPDEREHIVASGSMGLGVVATTSLKQYTIGHARSSRKATPLDGPPSSSDDVPVPCSNDGPPPEGPPPSSDADTSPSSTRLKGSAARYCEVIV